MRVVAGNARGTGAALNLCIGFVPDWVRCWNYADGGSVMPFSIWHKHFSADANIEGFSNIISNMSQADCDLTQGAGVAPHYGGVLMNVTTQPSITYGNASVDYVTWDDCDYRYADGEGPFPRQDSVGVTIDTWNLDTPGSYTGRFNEDVVGTYIGPNSRVCIEDKWYWITALTGGQGVAANEVQLSMDPVDHASYALATGRITFISGIYGTCGYPVARGDFSPAGFRLGAAGAVNTSGEMFAFEAGTYDN